MEALYSSETFKQALTAWCGNTKTQRICVSVICLYGVIHRHLGWLCLWFCVVVLLRSMHALGKEGENNFSALRKLADLSLSTQCSDIHEHPAFGFKSCLVQILGNLCWRHPENQNQVSGWSGPAGFIVPTRINNLYWAVPFSLWLDVFKGYGWRRCPPTHGLGFPGICL